MNNIFKKELLLIAVTSLIVLSILCYFIPSSITFEDAGLFAVTSNKGGILHPPGYPVYGTWSVLFANIPFISAFTGMAFFSTVCGTGLFIAVFYLGKLWGAGMISSFLISGSVIFSLGIFSQSIVPEVYSLHLMLFTFAFYFSYRFTQSTDSDASFSSFRNALIFISLGLAHHYPMFILSLPSLLVILCRLKTIQMIKQYPLMCIGLPMTIIVLAYLLLWLRSLINPIYSFAGTLDSWERFFHFILRKGYANVDNAGGTIDDKIDYLEWLFSDLLPEQFGIIGLGVTVCSMIWLIKGRERRLLLSLLLMFMGTSVLLIGLIGFEYNESSRAVFRVYPLTAWLSLALGCLALATFKKSKKWQVVLASLLFFSTIWNTFSKNLHTDFADRYAKATLRTFKPNATVLTTSDYELPLIYKVEYEGIRPDISLYNDKSLVFQNRLTHGIAPKKEKEEAYRSLIKESQAPVYFFGNKNLNPYGGIDNGFVKEVDRNRVQGWYESAVDTFYAELIGDAFTLDDPWERMVQKQSLDILARQLFVTDLTKDEFLFFHQKLERTDYGKVALAIAWLKEGRFQKENIFTQKYYLAMLQALYENPPSNAYDASWVQFAYLQINALDTNQTLYQLENLYLGSIQAYSRIDNPCLLGYIKLLWVTKQYDKLLSFVKNYRVRLSSSPVLEWLREKERNANTLQGELQTEVKQLQQRVVPLIQSLSLDSAEKMLEKLDELQPGNFHTHYLQGLVAEHQKRLNEALAFYLGSLRINDSYPPPLYGAVMLLKKVGHAKDAEMLLDLYEHVVRNDMLLQQLK